MRNRWAGRRGSETGLSRVEAICAIVSAVAAVAGIAIAVIQAKDPDPPESTDLGGEIIEASIDSATPTTVRAKFQIRGFVGQTCAVLASVFNAATGAPVSGLADQRVFGVVPEGRKDTATFSISVTMPTAPGRYFVTLVLLDPDGVELDRRDSSPVQIGSGGGEPNAYPNAAERALLDHIPNESKTRCQRADAAALGASAGVACEPTTGATAVWYYQYADLTRLQNAYGGYVTSAGISGGSCNATLWHGESSYRNGTSITGRELCYTAIDGRQWIYWTNEPLLIFAHANSPAVSVLLDWWVRNAGPV